ncbi:iron-containing alcohol dehydrogenase [Peribacillus frigoritolerans]|nr:iron-containing alcohol dehydrogenase [Peribacillus frigoritolerans]
MHGTQRRLLKIHAEIARALGVKEAGLTEEELALAGADAFNRLVENSGLKISLQDDGLSPADIDRLVEIAFSEENTPMRLNNCRVATKEEMKEFASKILTPSPVKA